jgi:hypothetical protein
LFKSGQDASDFVHRFSSRSGESRLVSILPGATGHCYQVLGPVSRVGPLDLSAPDQMASTQLPDTPSSAMASGPSAAKVRFNAT